GIFWISCKAFWAFLMGNLFSWRERLNQFNSVYYCYFIPINWCFNLQTFIFDTRIIIISPMNILILGSGGREHTFAHQISQSKNCGNLFVAPGNAGTSKIAENVALSVTDFEAIKALVLKESIEMLIVGPEDPLVHGIQDFFAGDEQLKHVT